MVRCFFFINLILFFFLLRKFWVFPICANYKNNLIFLSVLKKKTDFECFLGQINLTKKKKVEKENLNEKFLFGKIQIIKFESFFVIFLCNPHLII